MDREKLLQTSVGDHRSLLKILGYHKERISAQKIIDCAMTLIRILKQSRHQKVWNDILNHITDFETAVAVKQAHEPRYQW